MVFFNRTTDVVVLKQCNKKNVKNTSCRSIVVTGHDLQTVEPSENIHSYSFAFDRKRAEVNPAPTKNNVGATLAVALSR